MHFCLLLLELANSFRMEFCHSCFFSPNSPTDITPTSLILFYCFEFVSFCSNSAQCKSDADEGFLSTLILFIFMFFFLCPLLELVHKLVFRVRNFSNWSKHTLIAHFPFIYHSRQNLLHLRCKLDQVSSQKCYVIFWFSGICLQIWLTRTLCFLF